MVDRSSAGRRIRVVYVIDSLVAGGAERHLVRLIEALGETQRYDISVYCLQRLGPLIAVLEGQGIEVVARDWTWSTSPRRLLLTLLDLRAYLRREQPALAHCYLIYGGLLGALAARLAGVPTVITTRRYVHAFRGKKRVLYTAAVRLTDILSSEIISVCEAARRQAIDEGTPPDKIVTVYNSVPLAAKTDQKSRDGALTIGCVAELHPRKGHLFLLRAMPMICRALPDTRLLLVGWGQEREYLQAQAVDLGISNRVEFLGERMDIERILDDLDVFVLPSLSEGFPNAILEAMAHGLPVIATAVGGVPELIEDGANGVLVPPGDSEALTSALIAIGRDPNRRHALGFQARETAIGRFNLRDEVAGTEAVYARFLRIASGHNAFASETPL